MLDQKQWWMSKTVWGVVVMLLSSALTTTGIPLTPEIQGTIVELIMQYYLGWWCNGCLRSSNG